MTGMSMLRGLIAAGENAPVAVVIKATLLLVAALGVLRFARRLPASLRHRVAATTFVVLLLLPLVAFFAPARTVVVKAPAVATVAAQGGGLSVAAADSAAESPAEQVPAAGSAAPHRINLPLVLTSLYLAGLAYFLLSLAGGIWRLYRLRDAAEVFVGGTRMAKEMAEAEGIRRPIEVMITGALAVPMTFGSSRATILLPADAADWDAAEVRRALRHELEHIERGDWLTQVSSRLACAFYWPHPLVWALWQRLRLEAERACDDAVIRGDSAAEAYAEQLVALARRLVGRGQVPALAMATRSNLGLRVEAILDRGLRRGRLGPFGSFSLVAIALACLIGLAPLRVLSAPLAPVGNDAGIHDDDDDGDRDPLDEALLKIASIGDAEGVRRLIARGAKANAVLSGDGSPLIAAARGGHLEVMEVLIRNGADVNRGVGGDGNPLLNAAQHGQLDAVRLLLDSGAEIDRGVEGDGNALIAAAGAGEVEVVKYLLDRGAAIEAVVSGDENALIHASELGQPEVVKLLIERKANVNARVWADFGDQRRGEWRTPLNMATRNGHKDVVAILKAAGATQ